MPQPSRANRLSPSDIAPGAHILVRDAAWRVRQVDRTSSGGLIIEAVGLSEIVADKEAIFLEEYEPSIEVLDPAGVALVPDDSRQFRRSLLYLESQLRQIPPTDARLYVGHEAAMDPLPYQLEPAHQALQRPRQRMLIADAVGLGKTLEAGVLLSELIARGKAKRILVVAIKSMLTQFQKEMWSRFTIPLVRLDSVGLQRIRQRIPTNQNPFHFYDKAIVSVDTLKQNNEYRTYLENARWDVIVIDEAHNVARRGKNTSLRARLAELLSQRSDTLIMLSATPHDGKARSFASLMNMLDPTAIADPDDYRPDDIDGLFIRRFKKDIADQVAASFPDRQILRAPCQATAVEERAFDAFADLEFRTLNQGRGGHMLFKTALEKALFSSPAACIATLDERVKRLERRLAADDLPAARAADVAHDIAALRDFRPRLEAIGPDHWAKYQALLALFEDGPFRFTGWGRDDRLVIFTERIATMRWLAERLAADVEHLSPDKVAVLHGQMPDVDQQRVVEEFGQAHADLRLLVASDVASEGINLHYECHRMVHFDIPWSLLTFQQRNGRVDRYGQPEIPYIAYMLTRSTNARVAGDARILELLIDKDEQAAANIGDPSALMGVYDVDAQERMTASAIESGGGAEAFAAELEHGDLMAEMLAAARAAAAGDAPARPRTASLPSLFASDYAYLEAALDAMRAQHAVDFEADPARRRIALRLGERVDSLVRRLDRLPDEVTPADGRLVLTADPAAMQRAIDDARGQDSAWPQVHYLWRLSPVVAWANDRLAASFGRHAAPVLQLTDGLAPDERVFLVSGLIPNRRSQPLVHRWFGVVFRRGALDRVEPFAETRRRLGLGARDLPNRQAPLDLDALATLRAPAVAAARARMSELRRAFEDDINPQLNRELQRLEALKTRQLDHQEGLLAARKITPEELDRQRRRIDAIFDHYFDWIEDTMTSEDTPFIQIMAALAPY